MEISVAVRTRIHTHQDLCCRIENSFCPSGCYVSSHFRRATTSLTYFFFPFFFWHNDINLSRTAALKSPSNSVTFSSRVGGPFTYTDIYVCLNGRTKKWIYISHHNFITCLVTLCYRIHLFAL